MFDHLDFNFKSTLHKKYTNCIPHYKLCKSAVLKIVFENRKKATRKTRLSYYLKIEILYLVVFTIGRQNIYSYMLPALIAGHLVMAGISLFQHLHVVLLQLCFLLFSRQNYGRLVRCSDKRFSHEFTFSY